MLHISNVFCYINCYYCKNVNVKGPYWSHNGGIPSVSLCNPHRLSPETPLKMWLQLTGWHIGGAIKYDVAWLRLKPLTFVCEAGVITTILWNYKKDRNVMLFC